MSQYDDNVGEVNAVLMAMVGYVKNFFSCLECTKHFLDMVENGARS